ncbi:DUF5634 family protein [Robertmurraya korlensis]|uniref:DUF5634 family protein n=1 Tax=Robertmurraya korlensis TaxID=519977 RepID=UPI0020411473|nr:DUF5634 family protein [Robertmurraya korlensis]MCM3600853.1 DUF5634 family protein [Robertmurraya korlensis]
MKYGTREEIMNTLQQSFHSLMDTYQLEDIGVFEEQGPNGEYYFGYTINQNGGTYMLHQTYKANHNGKFELITNEWTIETDEPNFNDKKGYENIEEAFHHLH